MGYSLADGWVGLVAAVAFALVGAALWGTLAVPGDPSRSGEAPRPVSGRVRLVVEAVVLGAGVYGFVAVGRGEIAFALLLLLVMHYALSADRVRWLLEQ